MIFGRRLAQTYILGDKKGSLMKFDNLQRNLFLFYFSSNAFLSFN